ncbi:EAL domain-containing protein [Brucella intermedia]|uniref:putative bifunctional diguanylate cyclase/phosphodiesterase n=1 Tax=Brucella TaxID=234 RepID=UPI000DDCA880|nr:MULTISPECIES: bifunctional diguanylate cyclase/phosphodiesterase [Brucella]KAB2711535.1 EAL domain-containing protein [Brucella intermedia]MCH6203489.1 EAL domain-containing protein [Brucella ciceri]MDL2202692.1 EAL domain-containing protein [Brucella intermedia]QNQ41031.1 EAL domain-containing protein [Brucella intermedia]
MRKRGGASASAEGTMARTSEQDFRILFTTHPTPMWVYDPETLRFIVMNDAAYRLYGYTADEIPAMTVLDIRPQTERDRMLAAIRDRSDLERPERWQHLRANGETIDVLTYGRQVLFDGKEAILAIVQDRTEVTEANRQASHAQTLLDSLVNNLPLGVFVKDMQDNGRYVLFNQAASVASGQPIEEAIGATDLDLFPKREAAVILEQDRMAMRRRDVLSVERKVERKDGTSRTMRIIRCSIPPVEGDEPRYLIGLLEDVTERREIEERMAHIAMHDSLTGLPNRAYFAHHVESLLKKGGDSEPFALFYLDIDHFKNINDSIGHQAGDQLLQEVARRLKQITTPDEFIARLGGDEFAIVYRSGTLGQIAMFADRVLSAFQDSFKLVGNSEFVTCSMGISQAPLHGDNPDALMRNADLALYASKSGGRRTFRFYQHSLRLAAEKRHVMTGELRQALLDEQFELHYQPIFNLESGRISGFEALIRWRHPERGMVSPAEFIPLAEETGLIGPIGDWVLRAACREAVLWPEDIKVSVNLSPVQFSQTTLLQSVTDALEAARLSPDRLELEITESVFLSNSKNNIELLFELRRLGVRIAMDDFGTGYSSLSYLRSFPFDKIKIDRSFVSGIEVDTRDLAIIQAVATLGAGFNIVTTAEGVETAQQLERLKSERFGEVQGFLTGRPMPAGDVHSFIQNRSNAGLGLVAAHNTLPI